jgi:hypothetical protein
LVVEINETQTPIVMKNLNVSPTIDKLLKRIVDLRQQKEEFEQCGYTSEFPRDDFKSLESELEKSLYALSVVDSLLDELK